MGLLPSNTGELARFLEDPTNPIRTELIQYFSNKPQGYPVTHEGLRQVPPLGGAGVNDLRRLTSYLLGQGALEHTSTGNTYTGQNLGEKRVPSTPSREPRGNVFDKPGALFNESLGMPQPVRPHRPTRTATPSGRTYSDELLQQLSGVASEFFDLNDRIHRGIVTLEAGYYDVQKWGDPEVLVMASDHSIRSAIVRSHNRIFVPIANKMGEGDIVLVRAMGSYNSRLEYEPLTTIRDYDHVTLNGEPIKTVVEPKRILHLPIVSSGEDRRHVRNGIGFVDGESSDSRIPVFVYGAADKVWTIQDVRVHINRGNFIMAEI